MVDDFTEFAASNNTPPSNFTYKINSADEGSDIHRQARLAAYASFEKPLIKNAFDTRRINQETDRNPRTNLQYWHRTDPFIDDTDKSKLNTFAKLFNMLDNTKKKLGTQPEWFESYTRQLHDNVHRILRVKQADLDIFRPQLSYLEQLIYARYRLSMEDIEKLSEDELRDKILAKDEGLIGRNNYLKETTGTDENNSNSLKITKDGLTKTTQESIINAIFGADGSFRKDGEKNVERTITITIRDNVID